MRRLVKISSIEKFHCINGSEKFEKLLNPTFSDRFEIEKDHLAKEKQVSSASAKSAV